jgi:branched-chain amino acid transport system permease protein
MPEGAVSIERYARNILSFADALDLPTFHMVGVSLGGATAEGVAGLAPHRLRGLMLVDAPAPDGLVTPEERYPVLESFRGQPEMLRVALGAVTPFCKDHDWFDEAVAEALRMHPRLFTENARAIAAMDFRPTLPAYAGPALAIRGRADYLVTDAHQEAIRQALPQLQIEVWEDAGHSPPSDQPERFAARLADFCR